MHPAAGGGARRQPPRWRSRTASSDNSAFRTCSPPSRRSLRSPPLLGASAWTPAPRALRNGQLSDDAALHFPLRRGRCSGRCSERWTLPITPRRCVIRPNDSNHNPSHHRPRRRRIGTPAPLDPIALSPQEPRDHNAPRVMPGATPANLTVCWPNWCSSVTPAGPGRSGHHASLREGLPPRRTGSRGGDPDTLGVEAGTVAQHRAGHVEQPVGHRTQGACMPVAPGA